MGKTSKNAGKQKKNISKSVFRPVGSFFGKITAPVRSSGVWKFLRRTILKSPFKGYFAASFKELKNVTWPDRKTSLKLTLTVVLFSGIFAAFTTALDYGFEELAKRLFLR